MKLNSLYIVAFGAALASVEAAPLQLLAGTGNEQEVARGLRFGHAVAPFPARDVPQVEGRAISVSPSNRSPCFMRKMVTKAIKISNSLRKAVGLPLIESPIVMEKHLPFDRSGNGLTTIFFPFGPPPTFADKHLPFNRFENGPTSSHYPFIGTPPTFLVDGRAANVVYNEGGEIVRVFGPDSEEVYLPGDGHRRPGPPDHPGHPGHPDHHPHPPHHPHHGHHGHHPHHGHKHHRPYRFCRHSPFFRRLTFALMSLGKWEGRAVAFVLGCGLGVLLRMLWVLSVITYRTFNGRREEVEYTVIHEYIDARQTPVPPPTYTYVDEKAEAKKDAETPVVAATA